jgi:primase-polymerase (primpol)-like protein
MASENVLACLPTHITPRSAFTDAGNCQYHNDTKVYKPNKQGAARNTVSRFLPRVVSSRLERWGLPGDG